MSRYTPHIHNEEESNEHRARQFNIRFPTFAQDLEDAKVVCCFRKHSTGLPIYKNEESLWNRTNNEYRKLGFLKQWNLDEWLDFWYNRWEQFRQDHFEWLAEQGPTKNRYSEVRARDEAFGKALRDAYEKYDTSYGVRKVDWGSEKK